MAKRYPFEAATELHSGLYFGPEFLGLLRPAVIGGVDVHVVLPDFKFVDGEFQPRLHSRTTIDWAGHYAKPPRSDHIPFGKVTSWNPNKPNGGIEQFTATRLTLLSKDKVTEAEAQKLLHAVDDWLELLDLWIEIVAKFDLRQRGIEVDQHGVSTDIWLRKPRKGKKGRSIRCKHPVNLVLTAFGPLNISPLQWRKILAKASAGAVPPEAHVFLRDARHELKEKRYRRSVLDSATAAEVALTKLRDDALSSTRSKVASYVQSKAQQIGGLVEFHRRNGQTLPNRIQQEIGEPRNEAIHEGREPSGAAAAECLNKAEEVVELVFPQRGLL